MKIVTRVVSGLLLLGFALYLLQVLAAESGEVVVLTTYDIDGVQHHTRVWVVDHDGHQWLRAGSDIASWFGRLRDNPDVELKRKSTTAAYTALPDPSQRAEINRLMMQKYGWADRYIGFYFPRDDAIPVRLDKQ